MKIDQKETINLLASLVVLTVAFAYPSTEPTMLAVIALSVGSGFILMSSDISSQPSIMVTPQYMRQARWDSCLLLF